MSPTAPAIPPEQLIFAYIVVGLTVAGLVLMVVFKVAVWLDERRAGVEYRWEPPEPPEPGPFRAWIARHAKAAEERYTPRRSVAMSSGEDAKNESVSDLVSIPVSHISMPQTGMNLAAADIDAESADMPRLSRNISEDDELAFLCVVRNSDGKYRHSANAIYALLGGDRNTVLAKIKAIRSTAPVPEFRQGDGTKAPPTYPVTHRS